MLDIEKSEIRRLLNLRIRIKIACISSTIVHQKFTPQITSEGADHFESVSKRHNEPQTENTRFFVVSERINSCSRHVSQPHFTKYSQNNAQNIQLYFVRTRVDSETVRDRGSTRF